jgi:hypothetical protein
MTRQSISIRKAQPGDAIAARLRVMGLCASEPWRRPALARELHPEHPGLARFFDLEVDPESTDTAGELFQTMMTDQFLAFERALSVFQIIRPFCRPGVFQTQLAFETSGAGCSWIPESGMTPATALALDSLTLAPFKMGALSVLSKELLSFGKPGARTVVAQALPKATAKFLDEQFLDPAVAAIAGLNPASISNGAQSVVSTGGSAAQIQTDFSSMADKLGTWTALFAVLQPKTFAHIFTLLPQLFSVRDGFVYLMGVFRVIASANSPQQIAFIDADDLLVVDDGNVDITLGTQADIVADDAESPLSTITLNLWQRNLVAFKAIRTVSWQRSRSDSVVTMDVAY